MIGNGYVRKILAHFAYKKALLFKFKVIEPEWISSSNLQPTPLFKSAQPPKKIFSILPRRACPTNGSDCGSLRSHNLTLFVIDAETKETIDRATIKQKPIRDMGGLL